MSTEEDREALIAEAHREAGKWGPGPIATGLLLHRLADALEAAEKELAMRRSESADFERERDEAVAALEAAAASAPQVTDEMVDAAYRAALENGADRLWKADIRAALKAALGVSE